MLIIMMMMMMMMHKCTNANHHHDMMMHKQLKSWGKLEISAEIQLGNVHWWSEIEANQNRLIHGQIDEILRPLCH